MKGRIAALLAITVLSVSCSVTRMSVASPDRMQLNITMADLEYLGESEISVEYRTYLGFINVVDAVNGAPYDRQETKKLVVTKGSSSGSKVPDVLDQAADKLTEEYPTADYFRIVSTKVQKNRLFLGGQSVITAKVKAYRLLANEENSDCDTCSVKRSLML